MIVFNINVFKNQIMLASKNEISLIGFKKVIVPVW